MSSNPTNINPVQQYLNQMEQQYKEAESYIDKIEKDAKNIAHDEAEEAYWSGPGRRGPNGPTYSWEQYQKYVQDEAACKKDMKQDEENLKKLGYKFSNLDATINSFLSAIRGMAGGEAGSETLADDVSFLIKNLSTFFDAMRAKAKEEMYENILNGPESDDLTDAQLEQLATAEMGAASQEQGILHHLMNDLDAALRNYEKVYEEAEIDHDGRSWWQEGAKEEFSRIMNNAQGMIINIDNIMGTLVPEMASIMPEFTEDLILLDKLIKKMMSLLKNVKLSHAQKGEALRQLMFFALGLLIRIQGQVQGEKAKNQTDMSKANVESSQMNMDNAITQEHIQQVEYKKAQANELMMKILEGIAGIAMAIMTGGAGGILIAALTVAQVSGATEKATQALSNKVGGIAADVIMGAAEIILTAGGGAALDQMAQSLAQTGVKAAVEAGEVSCKEALEQTAKEVSALAAKEGVEQFPGESENLVNNIAEKAMKRAAQNCIKQFQKISLPRLIEMAAQGTLKETLQRAVTEAGELAAKDISDSIAFGATLEEIEQGADSTIVNSSDRAVANATNQSEKTIAKESAKSATSVAIERGVYTALYASLTSHTLSEELKKIKDSTGAAILEIIQMLMQMLVLMAGTGMMSQVMGEGSGSIISLLSKISSASQIASQGSEAAIGLNNHEVLNVQGKAVKALQMDRAVADLLHAFIEQQRKDMSTEQDQFARQEQNEFQSQFQLAKHTLDGEKEAIQVLMSAAG